jgi:hypothetical protein
MWNHMSELRWFSGSTMEQWHTYSSRTCNVWVDFATGSFLVYSTTVFQVHLLRTESAKWCHNWALYRMWKEAVMQILWYCPTIFLEVLSKTTKKLTQIRRFRNRQSNPGLPIQSCLHHDTAAFSDVWEELGWETRSRARDLQNSRLCYLEATRKFTCSRP